ncbi:MAG: HU family DNA-binding protein [Deltaproteobacteria bacterium]|nr:HU family DNA-binding protein [Deltaproteobacteria bacterium]
MAEKKPMTKSQIVAHMAEKFDMKKTDVGAFLEAFADLAYKEARSVGSFIVPGFGKLVLSKRKARMGRNPATGEPIKIPAKKVVKMRLAKACKDAIIPPKSK